MTLTTGPCRQNLVALSSVVDDLALLAVRPASWSRDQDVLSRRREAVDLVCSMLALRVGDALYRR